MASIERTAYPRFKRTLSARDLADIYTPTAQELAFVSQVARKPQLRLNLCVLLKAFQRLGYFPFLTDVPPTIVDHIRTTMRLPPTLTLFYPVLRTMRHHQQAIRAYLQITSASRETRRLAARAVYQAAQTMDTPADLINVAIEALRNVSIACETDLGSILGALPCSFPGVGRPAAA